MTESTPTISRPRQDALPIVAFACAAVTLGQAIHVRDGDYWPTAVLWLTASIVFTVTGVFLRPRREPRRAAGTVLPVLAAGALLQIVQLLVSAPSGHNPWSNDLVPGTSLLPFRIGVAVAGALVIALIPENPKLRRFALPLLLLTHFLLGVWLIRAAPDPHIDVYVFQQDGAKALLRGENPYTTTFPDIYRSKDGVRAVYGDDLTQGEHVSFGFPYLPLSLFLAMPGYLIAGDHRYSQLAAMTLAGALIAFARPGRVAALAAALLLFTPRGFYILGRGWTEPFTVLLLTLTVFLACRGATPVGEPPQPRHANWGLPFAAGWFLATKQYLVLAVPLLWLLLPRPVTPSRFVSFTWKAALAGLVVTLPLVLADVRAFWRSTVTVQLRAPYRTDALTFQNYWLHGRGLLPPDGSLPPADVIPPTFWPALAAAALAIALALWRAERSPAGFAGAVALVFVLFISLNKQAFANYYYFVIAALCCAVAAAGDRDAHADCPSSSGPPTSDN